MVKNNEEVLNKKVGMYNTAFDQRLAELETDGEKQQFIEGVVFAFDACSRFGNLGELTLVQREEFLGSALANSYSTAYHKKLDPEKHMRGLVESNGVGEALSFTNAAEMQVLLGIPLSFQEKMRVRQSIEIARIEKMKS